jgi:peptide/nickel transport system substrate-binding protein
MKASLWAVALVLAAVAIAIMPAPAMGQDSLGFGDNVTVQVTRANQTDTTNSTNGGTDGGTTAQPSGCLIATAAFGSELTPQVQFLRSFRDNHILSTAAGASFMSVFNSAYYSFSPQVADYEREQPWLQTAVKTAVYPLFGILTVAEKGYGLSEGEGGAVLAGFAASSLIGAVYLSPAAVALRKKAPARKLAIALGVVLAGSLALVAAGVAIENSTVLMASTALFVLSSAGIGICGIIALAQWIERRRATL